MFSLLRERARDQRGFTLIELLVVVIIIGILAAIAIPVFLGQQDNAEDANAQSLIRNASTAIESHFGDERSYVATPTDLEAIEPTIDWINAGTPAAADDQVLVSLTGARTYTLSSEAASGTTYTLTKNLEAVAPAPVVARTCDESAGCTW